MKKILKKYKAELIIILITTIIYALYIFMNKIYPFGQNSLIAGDVAGQYTEFWAYLKNVLFGKDSFIYSFSKANGGNMFGIWAYYLFSPFNIIFMLFKPEYFAEGLVFLTYLKILFCQLMFYQYIKYKNKKVLPNVIFSIAYGLSGYIIAFQMNIMWIDGVALLPIIFLGIEKYLKENKIGLYIWSLAIAIITNFYIGFSIAIFTGIYFIYSFIVNYVKNRTKVFLKFILYTLIGVGISAIILIPTVYILKEGKGTGLLVSLKDLFKLNFDLKEIFGKVLVGGINNSEVFTGLPNIYSGILSVILAIVFVFNKNIKLKEKLGLIVLLLLTLFIFNNKFLNLLLHGFKEATGFPYRYSFIFSFVIILIASRAFENIEEIEFKQGLIILGLNILAITLICNIDFKYMTSEYLNISIGFWITYLILLFIYFINKKKSYLILLSLVFMFELGLNYIITYQRVDHFDRNKYYTSVLEQKQLVDLVDDNSFYRMEKIRSFYLNDSLMFNYNGIGHSSSTFDHDSTNLLKNMGYNWYMDWPSYGTGNTIISDLLFGIKYKITNNEKEDNYDLIKKDERGNLFKIKKDLKLGFISDGYIRKLENKNYNPFKLQEEMLNQLVNQNNKYFENIKIKNIEYIDLDKSENNYYKRRNKNASINLKLDISNIENNNIYFYFDTNYNLDESPLKIYINGAEFSNYLGANNNGILNINLEECDKKELDFNIKFMNDEKINIGELEFKKINLKEFNKVQDKLSENIVESIEYKGLLNVQTNVNKKGYLNLLVQSNPNWKIYLNDEEKEFISNSEFLSIELESGKYRINAYYKLRGFKMGVLISLGSIIIFGIIIVNKKKKKIKG